MSLEIEQFWDDRGGFEIKLRHVSNDGIFDFYDTISVEDFYQKIRKRLIDENVLINSKLAP